MTVSKTELLARANAIHARIRAWRRAIHRYPELTFDEHRTAALVVSALADLDIEVETEVARTGVVGNIRGGPGPVIGLRADMDALPITEINQSEFDSTRPGIMHACGHDAHTAMLLGAATLLKELADQDRLPGTVRLLFQPSEEAQDSEGKSGGLRMVEEGALDGLDAVFGIHVSPVHDTGIIATRSGPMMAATDRWELVIRGVGGHAARPHGAVDPIALSGIVVNAIQQVISRRLDPLEPGVVTIGTIHGGTANNVIPETVELTGTIRTFSPQSRALVRRELESACRVVEPLGGVAEFKLIAGYPTTVNSEEATQTARSAIQELLGVEKMVEAPPIMAGEDFSYMAQVVPGCFMRIGVHDPNWGDDHFPVHRSDFKMDEDALPIGAAALAASALQWMEERPSI